MTDDAEWRPPCRAACATPGTGLPSCSIAARSPTTNTSGWSGSDRSGRTSTRPVRSRGAPRDSPIGEARPAGPPPRPAPGGPPPDDEEGEPGRLEGGVPLAPGRLEGAQPGAPDVECALDALQAGGVGPPLVGAEVWGGGARRNDKVVV